MLNYYFFYVYHLTWNQRCGTKFIKIIITTNEYIHSTIEGSAQAKAIDDKILKNYKKNV